MAARGRNDFDIDRRAHSVEGRRDDMRGRSSMTTTFATTGTRPWPGSATWRRRHGGTAASWRGWPPTGCTSISATCRRRNAPPTRSGGRSRPTSVRPNSISPPGSTSGCAAAFGTCWSAPHCPFSCRPAFTTSNRGMKQSPQERGAGPRPGWASACAGSSIWSIGPRLSAVFASWHAWPPRWPTAAAARLRRP